VLKGKMAAAWFMSPSCKDQITLSYVDLNILALVSIEHLQPVVHRYVICYLQ